MKDLVKLFNQAFNNQIKKGNKEAMDEGTKVMKELLAIDRPTATTYERMINTMEMTVEYVEKWAA